jgi:hypothetical protein
VRQPFEAIYYRLRILADRDNPTGNDYPR